MRTKVVGIDIGGTRTKMGIVDLESGTVTAVRVFDTCRTSETDFLAGMSDNLDGCLEEAGLSKAELSGAGVSVGSYVFRDGTIDGMSCFVPFMTEGYPLTPHLEKALCLPVRADNDVRLIGLAETRYGAGKGYKRTLTITLGSGVGIGVCVDGKPFGDEAFCHLAGHIKVRSGGEIPVLDDPPCYCGLKGCLESTCSGTSLEKYLRSLYGPEMTNKAFFALAQQGEEKAVRILDWFLGLLAEALNQYIYIYCPDVIILGGGIARGLLPWQEELQQRLTAKVHFRQKTELKISFLMEDSGILGAASLFQAPDCEKIYINNNIK